MNNHNPKLPKPTGLASAIWGSLLISLPAIPLAAFATPVSKLNPCPGIYYEEPFNSTRLSPQGCPPNAAAQRLQTGGIPVIRDRTPNRDREVFSEPLTPTPPPIGVIQPPLPETRSNPIALVTPIDGKVDVKLKNNTNAIVSYEAIGHTQRRFLAAGEEIVLQELPTPVTITAVRQDKGLLDVAPRSASQPGMLEISLDESGNLDDNLGALRIQKDGQVFLN
ncbi:MAG TPA: hypothetical protein DDZ80_30810 [Cyanobacteria bacterium UBA8803]|nr:hypothetical protein [Cyanobacteria bacterium UBA9273]HBL62616.1 hypothetical protein [Cyanobacteria bacterium UBA8803]